MKTIYINIDAMGTEYPYDTESKAIDMSYQLPYAWKVIALPVTR